MPLPIKQLQSCQSSSKLYSPSKRTFQLIRNCTVICSRPSLIVSTTSNDVPQQSNSPHVSVEDSPPLHHTFLHAAFPPAPLHCITTTPRIVANLSIYISVCTALAYRPTYLCIVYFNTFFHHFHNNAIVCLLNTLCPIPPRLRSSPRLFQLSQQQQQPTMHFTKYFSISSPNITPTFASSPSNAPTSQRPTNLPPLFLPPL